MDFTSCFVGIPLPEKIIKRYIKLQKLTAEIFPEIRLADPKTPHITLYYLDKQSINRLDEVNIVVRINKKILKSEIIVSNRVGYFGKKPKVLIIEVKLTDKLNLLHDQFTSELTRYRASDEFKKFTPHITIGKFSKDININNFKDKLIAVNKEFRKINWEFQVKEIDIYGVNSRIKPEKQQKLIEEKI